jgi:hypothetical protein
VPPGLTSPLLLRTRSQALGTLAGRYRLLRYGCTGGPAAHTMVAPVKCHSTGTQFVGTGTVESVTLVPSGVAGVPQYRATGAGSSKLISTWAVYGDYI